jgi:hypothetical protein
VSRSYFENARRVAGSILQMVSIGIPGEKGSALSGMQDFLAAFGHQHNFSLQDIHELLRLGVPVPLAGPGARSQFEQVDADLLESRRDRQPAPNFVLARRCERFRISGASRNRRALDIDLAHPALPC